ncbi:hypothetical protein [uncultured Succinivibrio sp.]|uniref:hypothetical protein n=1 Tax=uncultured Succinivibrio sp. TaxID=540749 RepID=UPI0025FF42F2|nr:hypothetical protein [uncultured Succinivibrio sp.]
MGHAQIERNEKNQLFVKLPRLEQKIRLPYDLEQMKTLISTDICSHIDIFGLDSAFISLDAENKDINRRGLLTNIKEKEAVLMHQKFENLKTFLKEVDKREESFLTGMSEVLSTYKGDAVKTLGTMTSIKYTVKRIFA